jgi:hypothetical protein
MSKEDFKKRTYKTVNKGQYNKDKTKTRKPKYTHLQYENNDNLSLVPRTMNNNMYKSAFSITTS